MTQQQTNKLLRLIKFSDRYELNIQFWPDQTAVYIEKGGVGLTCYGGDGDVAINSALEYLIRVTKKNNKV